MNILKAIWAIAAICLAQISFAQSHPTNGIEHYGADVITLAYIYDSIWVEDPETGEITLKIVRQEKRDLFNGEKLYYGDQASQPIGAASQSTLETFITNFLGEDIINFEKKHGTFSCAIIVNAKGKIVFLKSNRHTQNDAEAKEEAEKYKDIENKLRTLELIPAKKDGKAVYYGTSINAF